MLRLYVEVDAIEALVRMVPIKGQHFVDVGHQLVAVLAGLVGIGARKQGLDPDVRFMQQFDELLYLLLLRGTAVLRGKR